MVRLKREEAFDILAIEVRRSSSLFLGSVAPLSLWIVD